ncbi:MULTISPECIES: N-acetyltransferase family protein [Bacteria]
MTTVRPMHASDWDAVARIYGEGIEDGEATFELEVPSRASFDSSRLPNLRLVADDGGAVVGWAAASAVSTRAAYRGVIEHSVYVAREARGRGVGRMLLSALIDAAEDAGVWCIQSSIFPENTASLALHGRAGFRTVGRRERIARSGRGPHAGLRRDTVLIERRSAINGQD